MEVATTEVAPTDVAPADVATTEVAPADVAPTDVADKHNNKNRAKFTYILLQSFFQTFANVIYILLRYCRVQGQG